MFETSNKNVDIIINDISIFSDINRKDFVIDYLDSNITGSEKNI